MPAIETPTRPLAKVNIPIQGKQKDGSCRVEVCFLPSPEFILNPYAERGQGRSAAFLGLDASLSMSAMYGRGGTIFTPLPNYVQAVARKLATLLCGMSTTGMVSAAYWAVGLRGDQTEWIGEFDDGGWSHAEIAGPRKRKWGRTTKLMPVLKLAVERIHKGRNSDFTIAVFITDGIWEDHDDVKEYCMQLGQAIAAGKTSVIKLILVGVGAEADEERLGELDDLFEGTRLEGEIDLWATERVSNLKEEGDIVDLMYAGATGPTIIYPAGRVESASGQELVTQPNITAGLTNAFSFLLPQGETAFRIYVGDRVIEQDCSEALAQM